MSSNDKALEARIAELEATVRKLNGDRATPETSDRPMNRRTMLRMAAAAAGGAVVAPLVLAKPAAAATGDPLLVGQFSTTSNPGANTVLSQIPSASGPTHFLAKHSAATLPPASAALQNAPLWGAGAENGEGVLGWANGTSGFGIYGVTDSGFATVGDAVTGIDLYARGTGRVRQNSNFTATGVAPAYSPGPFETVRDSQGVVWISGTTASGGAWRRANNVIPITPVRVWDSRNAGGAPGDGPAPPTGATAGPYNAVTTVTLTLGGYRTIPAAASGLVCVLTVITPTGGGFIKAYPGGVAAPLAVVGNFPAGGIVSFYPTVGLGTGADAGRLSVQIAAGTGVQVGLDVTAYLM